TSSTPWWTCAATCRASWAGCSARCRTGWCSSTPWPWCSAWRSSSSPWCAPCKVAMPTLLVCLLAVPLASAPLVALLGSLAARPAEGHETAGEVAADGAHHPSANGLGVRLLSLASTLLSLVLAAVVAFEYAGSPGMHQRSGAGFEPQMVPGAHGADPHATTW